MSPKRVEDLYTGQADWVDLLQINSDELIPLCLDTILPSLQVWLEYVRAAQALGQKNFSPRREHVLQTVDSEFGLVSQTSKDFIASGQCTPRTIAAHSLLAVHYHLSKIAHFTAKNPDVNRQYELCYAFLRFVSKNSRTGRCLAPSVRVKAELAREAFVQATSWDATTSLPAAPGGGPPLQPPSDVDTPPNTPGPESALHRQQPPHHTGILLRVMLLSDRDEEMVKTRPFQCTFHEFEEWAIQEFELDNLGLQLCGIFVSYEQEVPDEAEAEGLAIKDQSDWTRALDQARRRQPDATSLLVMCNAEPLAGQRGSSLRTRPHFSELDFEDAAAALSADKATRFHAYKLSHERSPAESSLLLSKVLGSVDMDICVNKTRVSQATGQDLNYEATNPFEGYDVDYGTTVSHDYTEVQDWMTTPKDDFQNVAYAVQELKKVLGDDAEIIRKLPLRRSRNAADPTGTLNGDDHKPHQITGLFWTLYMEHRLGSFIEADGCGCGKTHLMISHVRASKDFWARKGKPVTRPTLVVCPRTLLEKLFEDFRDQLGVDWKVVKYGRPDGSSTEKVSFAPEHPIYKAAKAGMTVVVCSFQQLQACKTDAAAAAARKGLFARILIDEAQGIRRCDRTKQGDVLKSFDADYRGLFTGSPVVDSINDLDGYLAFLERPEWSEDYDRNPLRDRDGRPTRYSLFRARRMEGASLNPAPPTGEDDAWHSDCESVAGLDNDAIEEKLGTGWRCRHWPALLRINGPRPQSLERKPRRKRRSGLSADNSRTSTPAPPEAPFSENPYDYYHPDNDNSIRCCTTKAFRYWVKPHLTPNMVDQDRELVSSRVKLILDQLVLGRNLFSSTTLENGESAQVAADIPELDIVTQELRMSADEQDAYIEREGKAGKWLLNELTPEMLQAIEDGNGPKNNGSKFAKVSVLCTHLGLSGLEKVTTSQFRKRRQESLPMLVARMKAAGALDPADLDRPLDSDAEVVRQFLWGSPKFRFALWEIQRVIFGEARPSTHRKMLVFFQFPRCAEIFLKLTEFLGIRTVLLDTDMTAEERLKHIRRFDTEDDPAILITTYPLNIAGHDAQHRCANVLHAEPAFNWSTEYQAHSRVYRIGQLLPVQVIRLFTENTYQEIHEHHMVTKASSMFAAFKSLKEAYDSVETTASREAMAMSAFGICRRRVKFSENVGSAKNEAKERAERGGH